ncbi:uncharacterized protein LOC144123299 [Amblyomma americanum]
MMLNQFCFIVQALALFLQVQPSLGCAEEGFTAALPYQPDIKSFARASRCPVIEIVQPFFVSPSATSSVTSSHVDIPANQFCFIVQALALFLQVQPSLGCAEEGFTAALPYQPDIKSFARASRCPVIEIVQPFFVSPSATSSVTSSHVDIPAAIRSCPPAISTSGLGSSTSDMMLNQFCFIVQALALFLQVQPSLGCAEEGFTAALPYQPDIKSFARASRCPVIEIVQPFFVSPSATSSVTSSHVDIPAAIRSCPPAISTSGLGSSTSDMMLNQFCFIVQALALFLQVQPSLGCAEEGFTAALPYQPDIKSFARASRCPVIEIVQPFFVSPSATSSVTSSHVDIPAAIRSCPPAISTSGLGSSTSDMMLNQFCFIVQY